MRRLQKYACNLSAQWLCEGGWTKTGQKIAAGWAGLAVLSCYLHREISVSCIFLQFPHQVDRKYVLNNYCGIPPF